MTTEDVLQAALDAEPWSATLRLLLADHLEELGDERGPGYRALAMLDRHPDDFWGWLRAWEDDLAHWGLDKFSWSLPEKWHEALGEFAPGGNPWGKWLTRRAAEDAAARAFARLDPATRGGRPRGGRGRACYCDSRRRPMTATTAERDLFSDYEESTDLEISDYPALADSEVIKVCNCGGCGRLLLARRHAHLRHDDLYGVGDGDEYPPVCYRKRLVVVRGVTRAVPFCKDCSVEGTGVVRVKAGRYAL